MSRRLLISIALVPLAALALSAQERDATGAWTVADATPAVSLTIARSASGLEVTRETGGDRVRAPGALGATGWLTARFAVTPGLAGAATPGAAAPSDVESGVGLWEVLAGPAHLRGFFTAHDGTRRFEVAARPGHPLERETGGFVRHLRDAIAINQQRRPRYDARTGGASRALSRRLVLYERVVIPWAWWIDQRAKKWNRRGVMIVAGDFVSMQGIRPDSAPPSRTGQATDAQVEGLERQLKAFRAAAGAALDAHRFDEAARLAYELLRELERSEAAWGCHFAMTRHVVEQVGYAALNALTWRAMTNGETDGLARSFVKGLRLGLASSLGIDRRAQASHALGAGIIVNDVPDIPLAASYEAWAARRR